MNHGLMRIYSHIAVLLLVCVFLFLFGLGSMSLTDPDETFYAQTAKEMLGSDEWVTPMIFGKPQFEKPVLYYWLILASYKIFGVSEFSARLPSVIFAIFGVIGVYLVARLIFSPLCGLLSGFIMATCVEYIILARGCVTDMVLTVFILFCLFFFLLGWTRKRKIYYLLSSIMAGFAVLTKGPIGLFIPGVIIGPYMVTGGRWKEFKRVPVLWSMLVFLAVCLPWYFLVIKIHGNAFINEFFGFHNIIRFLEPEHVIGSSPFFYIPVIVGLFFPWSAFLPLGAWTFYKKDKYLSRVDGYKLFFSLWFLTIFVFFSVSRTKLVTYIFPLFPAAAIITGRFWEKFMLNTGEDRDVPVLMNISYSIFMFLSLAVLIGAYFVVKLRYPQAAGAALLCEGFFAFGVFLSFFFFLKRKKYAAFFSIIFAVMLLFLPLVKLVLPVIGEYESSRVLAYKVEELAGKSDPVGGESDHRRGIAFYSNRTDIEDIHPYPALVDFVSRRERVWGIIQLKHYKQVKEHKDDLYLEPVSEFGKYVLFTNKPFAPALKSEGKP